MRGLNRRGQRLELVAGLLIALAIPALSAVAAHAQGVATETALTAEPLSGKAQASVAVNVTGADGQAVSGAVSIEDNGKPLAGLALNAQGQANAVLPLSAGTHSLRGLFVGDAAHQASASTAAQVQAATTAAPDFTVTVAPTTKTLTAGQNSTLAITVTPSASYLSSLALTGAPAFVTLSCSGLPDQSTCTFTPETVEILPPSATNTNTTGVVTSSMVLGTQAAGTAASIAPHSANGVVWALLLPGVLGIAGIFSSGGRRRWLNRLSLVALVGLVTMLGTTACNPRYNYEHHGPPANLPTPAGTYTITITAQTVNGITAVTENTTLALTVN